MEALLQPDVLMPVSIVVIILGTVALTGFRKMREKELQYHQDLRIREMEHQEKMKQLEIEFEKAKGRDAEYKAA
jgi:hypothetical protein